MFLVRSVRARRSGPLLASLRKGPPRRVLLRGRVLRRPPLRPNPLASLVGRASAEARLRTQLGCLPLHVTSPKLLESRGHVASLVAV